MRVLRAVVVRSGGFAGIERTAATEDEAEAERIAAALPARRPPGAAEAVRDGFAYRITVVTTAGSETRETTDGAMGAELRAAVHALFAR